MLHIQINIENGKYLGTPRNYWTKEKGREAVKWLVEERLNERKINITMSSFEDNGLRGCLRTCFNDSVNQALLETYGKEILEKE